MLRLAKTSEFHTKERSLAEVCDYCEGLSSFEMQSSERLGSNSHCEQGA